MAAAAIYENAANPAQGLKTIEKRLLDERDTILKPAMDALARGGDEEWRKNFRETFKRDPNEKELRNMATDLMSGFDSAPEIDGWSIDPETSTDVRDKLAAIDGRLAIIDRTKEKISTLTNAEIKLTEGMTPEAFSVYRTLFSELSKGPGTSSRAARMSAVLQARHADNFARVISEKTGRKYTAKDYYQERFALGFNGQHGELNQKSNGHYGIKSEYITDFSDDVTRDDVEKALLELADKNLHNYIEDEDAKVNSRQRKKLTSAKASGKTVDNGFSVNDHFSIAKQIESVWNHAALVMDSPDEKNGHVDVRMRRYVAAIRKGTTPAFAWLTVKSTGDGLRIYSVELMDEKMLRSTLANAPQKYSADGPIRSFEGIISRLGGNVNAFNQIIGENGAAELDRQEEVTIRLDNLAVARQMEEAGKDAQAIKLATGWERGADNLWKYEIDDNWFALKAFPGSAAWREAFMAHQEVYSPTFYATLNEILLADDLFKAYPALKNVKVKMDELGGAYGEYTTKTEIFTGKKSESGEITLDYGIPESEVRNVLLHEVQHAIQDIEGFAEGANPNMFSDMESLSQEIQFQKERIREAEEVIERAEDLGYTEETIENGKTVAEWRILKSEAEATIAKVEAAQKNYISPEEKYRRSAGEVEARNVQRRMGMSWEDRQKTLLKDTEDVAREDQIFLRNGGAAFAVNVPIDENAEYPVIDLSQYTDNIGDTADTEQSRNKVMNYIIDNLVGTNVTAYSKDLMLRYGFDFGDTGNIHHVAYAHSTYGKNGKRSRLARNVTLSNLSDILSNSVLVEVNTKPKNKDGAHADKDHQANRIASVRAVMPVKLPNKRIMSMVITADTENPILERHAIDVSLYEIGIRKPGPRITAMQSEPGTMNIADILWNVKDTQGNYYVDHSTGKLNYSDKLFFNNEQTDAETYFQSAWHGTPHDFDTFDLGAIGTGEGAQAHGWGLYMAKEKAVAQVRYRERLTGTKNIPIAVTINGASYRSTQPAKLGAFFAELEAKNQLAAFESLGIIKELERAQDVDLAIKNISKRLAANDNTNAMRSAIKEALKAVETPQKPTISEYAPHARG